MPTPPPLVYRAFSTTSARKTLLPAMPANRRPFIADVISGFRKTGVLNSPSGLTANVVCLWLKSKGHPFALTYEPAHSCFVVTSSAFPGAPKDN